MVGVERKDPSMQKWIPAIKAGLALIAVSIVILIFQIFFTLVLSDYLRPLWAFWSELDTGRYPVHNAIFYLLYGVCLLVLANLLVINKGWTEALFDELQLTISKPALNYLLIGLIVGAVAAITLDVVQTISGVYLFNEFLYIGLIPGRLAEAVLFIIPLLVYSAGQVALVLGYFQRTISKNYGQAAGLIVAVFIYMLLFGFPNISLLLQSSRYPDLFTVYGIMITSSFIQTIIIGITIAYLFLRSKSPYLPIGFIFALHLFSYVFDGFVSSHFTGFGSVFPGYYEYPVSSMLQALISFLVLVFIWYFYHDYPESLRRLKGKLQNVVDFFRYHGDEE